MKTCTGQEKSYEKIFIFINMLPKKFNFRFALTQGHANRLLSSWPKDTKPVVNIMKRQHRKRCAISLVSDSLQNPDQTRRRSPQVTASFQFLKHGKLECVFKMHETLWIQLSQFHCSNHQSTTELPLRVEKTDFSYLRQRSQKAKKFHDRSPTTRHMSFEFYRNSCILDIHKRLQSVSHLGQSSRE